MWVGFNVGRTMSLLLSHSAWQIRWPSNGSLWNSHSFQPVGPWMSYSFTDQGAVGVVAGELRGVCYQFFWGKCWHGECTRKCLSWADSRLAPSRITPVLTHAEKHIYQHMVFLYCPACRTYDIATRFWEVAICPIYMCLTAYEFSFILFDLCLFITILLCTYCNILDIYLLFKFALCWLSTALYEIIDLFCFVTCLKVFWNVMS